MAEAENLLKFYETDYSENLYRRDLGTRRVGFRAPEIHHRDKIDGLVINAINDGNSYIKAEEGLYYIASTNFDSQVVTSILDRCKGKPLVGLMGRSSDVHFYTPMILILNDPEAIYKFYEGQLSFIVIVDSDVAKRKLQSHKVDIEFITDDKEWVAKVSKDDNPVSKIGAALWGRIYTEFISLDWFLNEIVLHITELSQTILGRDN